MIVNLKRLVCFHKSFKIVPTLLQLFLRFTIYQMQQTQLYEMDPDLK